VEDYSAGLRVLAGAGGNSSGAKLALTQRAGVGATGWSGLVSLFFTLFEIALVLFLLLRWYARRNGGWRRSWWLLRQETRLTGRAFVDPVRIFFRHRAEIRRLTGLLTDPDSVPLAIAALDDVNRRLTSPGAFPYGVRIVPDTDVESGIVTAYIAGRGTPTGFWQQGEENGSWRTPSYQVLRYGGQAAAAEEMEPDAPPRLLIPLGLDGDGLALADLTASPGVVSVYGDADACNTYIRAVAAFLDVYDSEAEVVVTRDLWQQGPSLYEVIEALDRDRSAPARPVVVVCMEPDPVQALRLSRLAAEGRLRAIVGGAVQGHRWELYLDTAGHLDAAALGLFTTVAPLASAVAAAIRRGVVPVPPRAARQVLAQHLAPQPALPQAVPAGPWPTLNQPAPATGTPWPGANQPASGPEAPWPGSHRPVPTAGALWAPVPSSPVPAPDTASRPATISGPTRSPDAPSGAEPPTVEWPLHAFAEPPTVERSLHAFAEPPTVERPSHAFAEPPTGAHKQPPDAHKWPPPYMAKERQTASHPDPFAEPEPEPGTAPGAGFTDGASSRSASEASEAQ
jgi:hypothetical protein